MSPEGADEFVELKQFGRYTVRRVLGRGGMGVVLDAFDPTLDRRVAIKVLHDELDGVHTSRLRREAQAMAKLSHPNVVHVYEVGSVDGRTFVAMELVEGQTLRAWMRQDVPPSWRECVEIFVQIGLGLAAAHEQGLVHRDFKPGNAIIDDKGRPRVLDFGLARELDLIGESEGGWERTKTVDSAAPSRSLSLTRTGTVLGTPAYMPLEQMRGLHADARSDQFSFCVALYEALYGERPFEGDSMAALMVSMRHGVVRPAPTGHRVPKGLRQALLRGLNAEPEQRWPSMEPLLERLRTLVAPRSARWVMLGGGVIAGLGLVVAGLAYRADLEGRCIGAVAQLEGIWDESRRRGVGAAIVETGLSYSADAKASVVQRLDDYAQSWIAAHADACEATTVRGEQSRAVMDLRMACLHKRRRDLGATVGVLAEADDEVVKNAVEMVASLPRLDRCDDVDWLGRQWQRVPPPDDPQVESAVEELRDELAEVKAVEKAGKYEPALAQVEMVVAKAESLGYGPLLAEAKLERGRLWSISGRYADAERGLGEAYAEAVECDYEEVELDASVLLANLIGHKRVRSVEGMQWTSTALPLAKRIGDREALASVYRVRGSVLQSSGEYLEAKEHHERAIRMLEQVHGSEHFRLVGPLDSLGSVFHRLGRNEDARVQHERALRISEGALGPHHPQLAHSLSNLGTIANAQGEHDAAVLHHERALQIREDALGPDHPLVAYTSSNIGNVLYRQGKFEDAVRRHRRALRILEEVKGGGHADVAQLLNNLGNALDRQGKHEQALRHQERALKIQLDVMGAEHPHVAFSLNNLGSAYLRLGQEQEAKERFEGALEVFEGSLGKEHANVSYPLIALATIALTEGQTQSARAYAERALAIREANELPLAELAEARFVLARCLWPDDAVRARRLAEQVRDAVREGHDSDDPEDLFTAVERWLADHAVPRSSSSKPATEVNDASSVPPRRRRGPAGARTPE